MGWETSIFTRAGIALIHRCIDDGKQLIISSAYAGADVFADGAAADATAMAGTPKQQLPLNITVGDAGQDVYLTVASAELAEGYQLRQIGVFAKADGDSAQTLLFLMQDETGFAIPSASEMPYFSLTVTACLNLADAADLEIRQTCLITPSDGTVTTKKLAAGAVTRAKLGSDVAGELDTLELQFSSPYNFKGTVAAAADLPSSGNTVNDTYYVEALKYRMTWNGSAWSQSSLDESDYEDELSELNEALFEVKSNVDEIDNAFNLSKIVIEGTTTDDKYISTSGVETSQAETFYVAYPITSDHVGKRLIVSGVSWYAVKPYVFVSTGGTVTYYATPAKTTATEYAELEVIPAETGTLYVNGYNTGGTIVDASAYLGEISSIKNSYLPKNIAVYGCVQYEAVSLEMTGEKLLNGGTGVISNSPGNTTWQVSDYTDITNATRVLISTEHFYAQGMYAFYDDNKVFVSGFKAESGATVTVMRNKVVDVPSNAKYIVIGFLYQASFASPSLFMSTEQKILPTAMWAGCKWACIGDSLTASYGVTDIHYFEWIAALTGIEPVNLGASGNGYAHGASNFMQKALLVPADSDVVTIFGSGNDGSSSLDLGSATDTGTTTIAGCINTAIDNVFSVNPVVPLGIITPTPWKGNMPSDNGFMEQYSNLIVEICRLRSIPCLDLFHGSNLDPNSAAVRAAAYSKDGNNGVHLDETGQKIIASHIKSFLQSLIL